MQFDDAQLKQKLDQGAVVIVPNHARAQSIRSRLLALSPNKTQLTPNLYSLDRWLTDTWQSLLYTNKALLSWRVLSSLQLQTVWRRCIALLPNQSLRQLSRLAVDAQKADSLLQLWMIPLESKAVQGFFKNDSDAELFLQLRDIVHRQLKAKLWIDRTQRDAFILESFEQSLIASLPELITLDCKAPPLHQKIFQAAADNYIEGSLAYDTGNTMVNALNDAESEWYAAAYWARTKLESAKQPIKIGIAVPALHDHQRDVQRIFTEILQPELIIPTNLDVANISFHLSAKLPLMTLGMARDALLFLQFVYGTISREACYTLMHSSFFPWQEITTYSTKLADKIRDWHSFTINLAELIQLAKTSEISKALPNLITWLESIYQHDVEEDSSIGWAYAYEKTLKSSGWQHSIKNQAVPQQHIQAWHGCLTEFYEGDEIYGAMDYEEALCVFDELLNTHAIDSDVTVDTAVYVVDIETAIMQNYDCLWISGLNAENWPPLKNTNHLLPQALQTQYAMPYADFNETIKDYAKMTEQLLMAAPEIILSYAEFKEGNALSGLSQWFTNKGNISADKSNKAIIGNTNKDNNDYLSWWRQIQESTDLIPLKNKNCPVVNPKELEISSAVIKNQSNCAFQAFAARRLRAGNAPIFKSMGVSALERGIFAHGCAQELWGLIKDSHSLGAMQDEVINTKITDTLEKLLPNAIDNWRAMGGGTTSDALWTIEARHIKDLLQKWLGFEKTWGSVHHYEPLALEQAVTYSIAKVTINLRIDRIDRIADNNSIRILDYKTGKGTGLKASAFESDYPTEPQLMIYALAYDHKINKENTDNNQMISAVGWVLMNPTKLDSSKAKFINGRNKNVFAIVDLNDKLEGSSKATLDDWHKVIKNLAEDYTEGEAKPEPRYSHSCDYCDYAPLCRIHHPIVAE